MHETNRAVISAREEFEWQLPSTFNFGRDVVDVIARAEPDKLALIWCDDTGNEKRFSFGDVARQSSRLAALLAAEGVKRGDRVLVIGARQGSCRLIHAANGCLSV